MQDDISDIRRHYDAAPQNEHDRLVRHQLEYEMTMALFEQYLPAPARILEIGGATGRYTVELLRRGHQLTAIDLSPALVEQNARHVAEAGFADRAEIHVADARDLSVLGHARFDAVLLMGPLYHLVLEADRELALQQARDRLVPGGLIFTAFISRYGLIGDLMAKMPDWIERANEVRGIIESGSNPDSLRAGSFRGYFTDVQEIVPFHERLGFQTMELAAVEPVIAADDESYNRLEGEQRRLWFDLLFEVRNNPTTVGASRHLLYVGRKASV